LATLEATLEAKKRRYENFPSESFPSESFPMKVSQSENFPKVKISQVLNRECKFPKYYIKSENCPTFSQKTNNLKYFYKNKVQNILNVIDKRSTKHT
jgi:hypothetical protein